MPMAIHMVIRITVIHMDIIGEIERNKEILLFVKKMFLVKETLKVWLL